MPPEPPPGVSNNRLDNRPPLTGYGLYHSAHPRALSHHCAQPWRPRVNE